MLGLGGLETNFGAPVFGGLGGAAPEAGSAMPYAIVSGVCFSVGVIRPNRPVADDSGPELEPARRVRARLFETPPTDV